MTTDDAFKYGFSIFGPVPVRGRPSLYRVRFIPHTLMAVRALDQPAELVKIWDAEIVVDATGGGSIIEHRELTPPVAELQRADFEAKALQLVREI